MASHLPTTNQSSNHCSICLNAFNQPKLIDCHHSFCFGCLQDYVTKFTKNGSFPCPLCRKNIQVPSGGVSEFSSNFYIDQTVNISNVYCVYHDDQKPVELYCNQCYVAVCPKCFTTQHNGHDFVDLESETSKDLIKIEQKEVTKQLETNLEKFDESQLEMLKFITLRLDLITKLSQEKVDKKVEELCHEVKKQGEVFKAKIQDLDDTVRGTINKAGENKKDMVSYIKSLSNSSTLQSLIGVLDTLPKAKAMLADQGCTDVEISELSFPMFMVNPDEMNLTEEQLGTFDTTKLLIFTSWFPFENLKDEDKHCAEDHHAFEKLSLCLAARKRKDKLGLYLNLNENDESKNLMYCSIQFTIKLISSTDSSKSKTLGQNHSYKAGGQSWGWSFIDWDKFIDPENGFIDDDNNFQVEASAIYTDLKWNV